MPMVSPVSTTATSAATIERVMIRCLEGWELVRLLMIERNSSGLMIPTKASTVTRTRNTVRMPRYGRAKRNMRRAVPLVTCWPLTESSRRMERMTEPNWPPPPMPWPGMLTGSLRDGGA